MSTKLELKKRDAGIVASIPMAVLQSVLDAGETIGSRQLWGMFFGLKDKPATTHDRVWLETIVNWSTGDKGVSMIDQARWLKIAGKVARLTDESTSITLTLSEDDLIWTRMQDAGFTPKPSFALSGFVSDYLTATGHHFANVKDDPDEENAPMPIS